jgi:hypothetical protein
MEASVVLGAANAVLGLCGIGGSAAVVEFLKVPTVALQVGRDVAGFFFHGGCGGRFPTSCPHAGW